MQYLHSSVLNPSPRKFVKMKIKTLSYIFIVLAFAIVCSCNDEESFTVSESKVLTFSIDTLKMDTLFSNVPSAAKSFWAYNRSGDGLRCRSIRLENGANSGFRVNVDGIYLGENTDYQTNDVEVRNKDSIRIFVEVTLPWANSDEPKIQEDNLVFTLESGVEQKVNLNAWAWDATMLRDVRISKDSTLQSNGKPIVIYGGLRVDSAATLTLAAGTTLYFNTNAGMDVYGRLLSLGNAEANVVLRGDRIDRMFNYLPYDRVPAQWMGVHFYESSYGNEINYTDIHSTNTGIEIDSSDVSKQKLTISHSSVHNCQGYGLHSVNAWLSMLDCQISNTLYDCVQIEGGNVDVNNCTFAQFYPFDARRGAAFAFSDSKPLQRLNVLNSLITGYADDLLSGTIADTTNTKNYLFDHCIIRTPKITSADSMRFVNVIYEDIKDTTSMGEKHFVKVDTENLIYDFRLDNVSAAIGKANPLTALPDDRNGVKRDEKPDVGAFEYKQEKEDI